MKIILRRVDDTITDEEKKYMKGIEGISNNTNKPFFAYTDNERYLLVDLKTSLLIIDENYNYYNVSLDNNGNIVKIIDDDYEYNYSYDNDEYEIKIVELNNRNKIVYVTLSMENKYIKYCNFNYRGKRGIGYEQVYDLSTHVSCINGFIGFIDSKIPDEIIISKTLFNTHTHTYYMNCNNLFKKTIFLGDNVLFSPPTSYEYEYLKKKYQTLGCDINIPQELLYKLDNKEFEEKCKELSLMYRKFIK